MNLFEKGVLVVRNAKLEDVLILRDTLRAEDRAEIWASFRQQPEKALAGCYSVSSVCHTVLRNGKPIGMGGLIPDVGRLDQATIWFLGNEDIELVKKTFLVACRRFVPAMLTMFPVLYNYVDARYEKSVRWLRWLGAEVAEPAPHGLDGNLFRKVTFRRA